MAGGLRMFLFTVTKPGLRQAGALALCAVCLCGTVAAAVHFSGDAVAAAAPVTATVETTQDIGTYFTGYGFETDLSSAAVDKVKIPKKWDDSFTAFNQVVQESGLDLGEHAPLVAGLFQALVHIDGAGLGGAAHGKLHHHNGQAQHQQAEDVQQHKAAAAVAPAHPGELPYIAAADGTPGRQHDKA